VSASDYIWDAAAYADSAGNQGRWAAERIQRISLKGDERILDIGCGDGRAAAALAQRVPNGDVLGIDSSLGMVKLARKRHPEQIHPNLDFAHGDAGALPFENAFDLVFSNAALHWVQDHRPVLRGIARALSRGGRADLEMGGQGNAAEVRAVTEQLMAAECWRPHFQDFRFPYGFHSVEDYRAWLQAAGMEPVRVELVPRDMHHQDIDAMKAWARTTWLPFTQQVPEAQREQFVDELASRYLERCPADADGGVQVAMVRLEVEAVRR